MQDLIKHCFVIGCLTVVTVVFVALDKVELGATAFGALSAYALKNGVVKK